MKILFAYCAIRVFEMKNSTYILPVMSWTPFRQKVNILFTREHLSFNKIFT